MDNAHLKDLLHSRALKATNTRLSLLAQMEKYESAMPYSAIQETFKSLDRVTLYRTLESLKEQGVIHKAFQENNDIYYAICGSNCGKDHHHHDHLHFKCVKCEAVTCEKSSKKVEISVQDFEIHNVSIHIEGICKNCKRTVVSA